MTSDAKTAQLTIKKAEAAHAGTYLLSGKNDGGEATTEITLKIAGTVFFLLKS